MVLEICGGTASEITVAGEAKSPDKLIEFPADEVKRLSGLDLPLPEMKRILEKLGFFVAGTGKSVKVAVPSWRPDIEGKADIVEEVVRIAGVDRVPCDRIPARRRAAQTRSHHRAASYAQGQARACSAGPRRSGDMVVHLQAAGRIVRRRRA